MQQTVRFVVQDSELKPGNHDGKSIELSRFFAHLKPKMKGAKLWGDGETVHIVLLSATEIFRKNGMQGAKLTLKKTHGVIQTNVSFASGTDKNCVHPGEVML